MMNMRIALIAGVFALSCSETNAAQLEFDNNAPSCHQPSGKLLPAKFYRYPWAKKSSTHEFYIAGDGENILDGSDSDSMRVRYGFLKADVNNDGLCDWLTTLSIPSSTGGDRSTVNTIYLGQKTGWKRIGAASRGRDKPADFGTGPNNDYDFFETAALLHENSENKTYVIGVFWSRHGSQWNKPGYHIFIWNKNVDTLMELDKWGTDDSPGSQAYSYFKKYGAFSGDREDVIEKFSNEPEELELEKEKASLEKVCPQSTIPAEFRSKCEVVKAKFPAWLGNLR